MRQPWNRAVAIALLASGGAACAFAGAGATPLDPAVAREQESRIERTLVERLGPDAASIRAVWMGSKVLLAGETEHRATAELSSEVVLSLDGVRNVSNRVHARRDLPLVDGKLFLEGKDAELEIQVKRAIWREVGEATARAVEVEACEGVVSLRGTAPDAERRSQALASARHVAGVRGVLDLLRASS